MMGDYHRYPAEFTPGLGDKQKVLRSASDIAVTGLPPTHPIRLGLGLNFSVFYHKMLNSPDRACHLAKQAFDNAIAELDTLTLLCRLHTPLSHRISPPAVTPP